ncbi:diguanylate cyclase domain-containing protein [Pelomonas sp. Root1237]|uniref:diguanylate cyclase domain-containing protein n=1 Tax=Pelomonas sp. Root1237 TaxID=1736434 RepID=UPI0007004CF6|nr:diguanylate cyclase [Pelomonas sp. Root1237]KQV92499.1 hypothetical protein ASC91_07980 [Pelomonas sp. Root1237]
MSDDAHPPRAPPAQAQQPDEDVGAIRAELLRLRQDLEEVQQQFSATQTAQLRDANEQLVLAVMQAEAIAEAATDKLMAMTRITQRDALTDTPNRALMLDRLQTALSMAKRRHTRSAVLFVDIDRFKHINDNFGHLIGDEALKLVALNLGMAVRDSDTVSRHSGDEFLVLLAEISKAGDAAQIALKMLHGIAAIRIDSLPAFRVSASVGIAIYPDDGRTAMQLIDKADSAMYRAKKMGGAMFQFHGAEDVPDSGHVPDFGDTHGLGTQPVPLDATPSPDLHRHALRDANEQLLLSALASRVSEERAMGAHQQHVIHLAMVAHELRSPLAPLSNAAELLSRARGDESRHAWLQEVIKRQVAHMTRIVNDLLDGSRAETGKFHLVCGNVDLVEILGEVAQSCQPAMDEKHQRLRVSLPQGPLNVHGDPVRLEQVFRNLLDNAVKYTRDRGHIALTAAVIDRVISVTVSDNGIGIVAEALPHVFDLFVQNEHAMAMHHGGLGIGLAVVRELVEAHGGTVVAVSAGHDKGSEFIVKLPLAALATP